MQGNHIDLLEFCFSSDFEFYENYLADLPLEDQAAFMKKFPEFLSEKTVGEELSLKNDELFRSILG